MTVTPHELKEALLERAFQHAGIDRQAWHPDRGFDVNQRTIGAVYDYYGRLFLEHPLLRWAGMANLIGPSFYAGFKDLRLVPDTGHRALLRLLGWPFHHGSSRVQVAGFYEKTFLVMQKKIFEDQAPMHEGYIADGLPKIEELYDARIIDLATLRAWQEIDLGRRTNDPALIDRGNRVLLFREQFDIIDRFYLQMLRHHGLEGRVFTYLLTLAGTPSIPGAQSFPERFPLALIARLVRFTLSLRTPLANGNIAVFANRWKLIEDDTLPKYLAFLCHRGDQVRTIANTPVAERAVPQLLRTRVFHLVAAAFTRWRLRVSARPGRDDALPLPPRRPLLDAKTPLLELNLTRPPTRESVRLAAGADSRLWMNRNRRPFDLTVRLPGERAYQARAAEAVMLNSTLGGDPDRLMVQPPASELTVDTTMALILRLAAEWGFSCGRGRSLAHRCRAPPPGK